MIEERWKQRKINALTRVSSKGYRATRRIFNLTLVEENIFSRSKYFSGTSLKRKTCHGGYSNPGKILNTLFLLDHLKTKDLKLVCSSRCALRWVWVKIMRSLFVWHFILAMIFSNLRYTKYGSARFPKQRQLYRTISTTVEKIAIPYLDSMLVFIRLTSGINSAILMIRFKDFS